MRMWESLVKFSKDAAYTIADLILRGRTRGWEARGIGGVKGHDDSKRVGSWRSWRKYGNTNFNYCCLEDYHIW